MAGIQAYVFLAIAALIFYSSYFQKSTPILETSGNVTKATSSAELDAVLKSNKSVVVDFYADWCPPCRAIAPLFSKLADEHGVQGKLAFAKVNVDHVKDVSQRYGVRSMPTFVVFRDGKPSGVPVEGMKGGRSVQVAGNGSVERIQGADAQALQQVVKALSQAQK